MVFISDGVKNHLDVGDVLRLLLPSSLLVAICPPYLQQVRPLLHLHVRMSLCHLLLLASVEGDGQEIFV